MGRVGLVTGLLVWSGWPQRQPASGGLLSVPVVDAGLPLLAVTWPRLAQTGLQHQPHPAPHRPG